jgi:hypothetical protein
MEFAVPERLEILVMELRVGPSPLVPSTRTWRTTRLPISVVVRLVDTALPDCQMEPVLAD